MTATFTATELRHPDAPISFQVRQALRQLDLPESDPLTIDQVIEAMREAGIDPQLRIAAAIDLRRWPRDLRVESWPRQPLAIDRWPAPQPQQPGPRRVSVFASAVAPDQVAALAELPHEARRLLAAAGVDKPHKLTEEQLSRALECGGASITQRIAVKRHLLLAGIRMRAA